VQHPVARTVDGQNNIDNRAVFSGSGIPGTERDWPGSFSISGGNIYLANLFGETFSQGTNSEDK
jgi:hypothetical protein